MPSVIYGTAGREAPGTRTDGGRGARNDGQRRAGRDGRRRGDGPVGEGDDAPGRLHIGLIAI